MKRVPVFESSALGFLAFTLSGALGAAPIPDLCTEKVMSQGGHEDYACIEQTDGRRPIACYEQIEESCMEGEGRRRVKVFIRYTGSCQAAYEACM